MPQQKPSWRFDQVAGTPLALHGRQITPIARVLRIEWLSAKITWQNPLAVEVRDETTTYRVAIPNVTRRVLVGMVLAAGVVATLAALWNLTRTA
jgi:hypothetical protein